MVQFFDDDTRRAAPGLASAPVPPPPGRRAPAHLWVVGTIALLWNAFGAADYLMSQLRNRSYLASAADSMGIPVERMVAWLDSFPTWHVAFWALGVWGAVAGSVLLLMRRRQAVWAFAVSLLGLVVTNLRQALIPQPDWIVNARGMTIVIWSLAIFLLIYAISMARKGVLR